MGERRVGKSHILYQIMDLIKENDNNANIIYINKELHEFEEIVDHKSLIKYVEGKTQTTKKRNYLFVDEIQDIDKFEKALGSLKATGLYRQ